MRVSGIRPLKSCGICHWSSRTQNSHAGETAVINVHFPPHTTSDLGGLRVCLVSTERRRGFPGARWRFSAGGWGGGRSVRCETLFMKTTLTQTASQILQFQSCPWEILMEAELCQNIYLDRAIHILSLQFSNA